MKRSRLFHAIVVTGVALVGLASGCGEGPEDPELPGASVSTHADAGGGGAGLPDASTVPEQDGGGGQDAGDADAGFGDAGEPPEDAGMDAGMHPTK